MSNTKAQLIVDQMNPIIRRSKNFICKLDMDYDNQEIILMNCFNAILFRVHYPEKNVAEVLYDIVDFIRG